MEILSEATTLYSLLGQANAEGSFLGGGVYISFFVFCLEKKKKKIVLKDPCFDIPVGGVPLLLQYITMLQVEKVETNQNLNLQSVSCHFCRDSLPLGFYSRHRCTWCKNISEFGPSKLLIRVIVSDCFYIMTTGISTDPAWRTDGSTYNLLLA